jgi:hypothetical protein
MFHLQLPKTTSLTLKTVIYCPPHAHSHENGRAAHHCAALPFLFSTAYFTISRRVAMAVGIVRYGSWIANLNNRQVLDNLYRSTPAKPTMQLPIGAVLQLSFHSYILFIVDLQQYETKTNDYVSKAKIRRFSGKSKRKIPEVCIFSSAAQMYVH